MCTRSTHSPNAAANPRSTRYGRRQYMAAKPANVRSNALTTSNVPTGEPGAKHSEEQRLHAAGNTRDDNHFAANRNVLSLQDGQAYMWQLTLNRPKPNTGRSWPKSDHHVINSPHIFPLMGALSEPAYE